MGEYKFDVNLAWGNFEPRRQEPGGLLVALNLNGSVQGRCYRYVAALVRINRALTFELLLCV